MKYYIRTREGEELTVSDGSHVVMLFRQKFLSPDDEIRREGSERWRKMRDVPEYASMMRQEQSDVSRFKNVFIVVLLGFCLLMIAILLVNRTAA